MLCVSGQRISGRSLATASEQGQGSWHILSQYGNCSSSSAAQRLVTMNSLSRLRKIPVRSTTPPLNLLTLDFSFVYSKYKCEFSTQVVFKNTTESFFFLLLLSVVFGTGLEISGSAPAVKRGWRGRNGVARKRVVEVVEVVSVGGGALKDENGGRATEEEEEEGYRL